MDEDLFGVVQAQLEENRQRRRDRPGGGRYLLQGLVVCKRCGYGCYGKPTSRASTKGQGRVPYAYYRCTGSDAYRFGGQRLCWNKQVRTDMLDAAVWDDVHRLLSEPERVQREYERRLQGAESGPDQEVEHLGKLMRNVKRMISRLIDAYGDGLLGKSEFEPRITAARERLSKLEAEHQQRIGEAAQEAELWLVIGQLEEFAKRVSQGLQEPDWNTRREVIRALVKRVEIDEQEVRIVYRVMPTPFEGGPQRGCSQHCWGRAVPVARKHLYASVHRGLEGSGTRAAVGCSYRQLRGRLRDLLSGHRRRGDGHDAEHDGEATADGEREEDTAVSRSRGDVRPSRVYDRPLLVAEDGQVLHRNETVGEEDRPHQTGDQRPNESTLALDGRWRPSRTTEPADAGMVELLLSWPRQRYVSSP